MNRDEAHDQSMKHNRGPKSRGSDALYLRPQVPTGSFPDPELYEEWPVLVHVLTERLRQIARSMPPRSIASQIADDLRAVTRAKCFLEDIGSDYMPYHPDTYDSHLLSVCAALAARGPTRMGLGMSSNAAYRAGDAYDIALSQCGPPGRHLCVAVLVVRPDDYRLPEIYPLIKGEQAFRPADRFSTTSCFAYGIRGDADLPLGAARVSLITV